MTQGFVLVREEQRTNIRLYMMARRAERLDLSSWFGQRSVGLRSAVRVNNGLPDDRPLPLDRHTQRIGNKIV